MNMQTTVKELYRVYELLNVNLFSSELPNVQLVVTETASKNAYGWFTPYAAWIDEHGEVEKHEIALSAEYLSERQDNYFKIVETLLHEMIHLYCHVNEIKDTSRQNRYHNKKFKEACEAHGMYFEIEQPHSTVGWSQALLTVDSQRMIESWDIKEDAFKLHRITQKKPKARQSQVGYVCPSCNMKLRGKRELHIICGDCDVELEEVEK